MAALTIPGIEATFISWSKDRSERIASNISSLQYTWAGTIMSGRVETGISHIVEVILFSCDALSIGGNSNVKNDHRL
jgi:hypothetical protein